MARGVGLSEVYVASRQSQLHSYQFASQRLVSALVTRDPDPAQSPFRRVGGAAFASTMVGILALAAIGIYGLIVSGGNTTWRTDGAIVVERESGANFVYLDGQLHPVVNFASALLASGSSTPKPISVSRRSLAGAPRGTPWGIPGAPDSLPDPNDLLGAPWTVCSNQVPRANGSSQTQSALLVGVRPTGGRSAGRTDALFVRAPGAEYMIWNAHKFRVPPASQRIVHDALAVRDNQVIAAAPALLNVLPPGVDLAPLSVARGGASKAAGLAVGDRVSVTTPGLGAQNFVVLSDGLASITQLQANLLASAGSPVREQTQNWLATQPRSATKLAAGDGPAALPDNPPTAVTLSDGQRAVCAAFTDASGVPQVSVDASAPNVEQAAVTGSQSSTASVLADRVVVAPGRGAIVAATPAPDAPSATLCLVTDLGIAFPLASADVLAQLGYRASQPLRLPDGLVSLLPRGPVLDPAAARAPAVLR